MRSSHEKAVRLFVHSSICLSVERVDCDKMKESYAHILYYIKEGLS